jgi:hypothetical protein
MPIVSHLYRNLGFEGTAQDWHSDNKAGQSTEPAPTGWIHDPTQVDWKTDYGACEHMGNKGCGNLPISHHHAHPVDNRSIEQDEEGWKREGEIFQTHQDFNDIVKNNNLNPHQFGNHSEGRD